MPSIARASVLAAAQWILDQGGWCVFEVCVDVAAQRWEARVVLFDRTPAAVADSVVREVAFEPELDARLSGCDRRTLGPAPEMGRFLCYLGDPAPVAGGVGGE